MIVLALTVLAVLALLSVSELVWRASNLHPEYTRKFVHISVGSFVAFWPLFLSQNQIVLLSFLFVAGVGLSYYLNLFKAIRSVQRPTWGEIFFALAVGVLAYTAHSGWIYLAALLHMSIADGLAAIVGTRFGKRTQYYVFGARKSIVGTATFLVLSLAILCGYALFTPNPFSFWFLPLALAVTVIENAGVRGLDNLLVPLLVAIGLNALR